ncbi:M48 family metalloprotease, partial [Vibrio parahaemolyticus]
MSDDQLYYLIGHELGHIKAGHVLYFSLACFIAGAGVATFGLSEVALL